MDYKIKYDSVVTDYKNLEHCCKGFIQIKYDKL